MTKSLLSLAVTAFILGGCSLIPDYQTPEAPVAAQWPQGPAYSPTQSADVAAAEQGWRQFFHDPALQQLIQTSLVNNRDLRVAALNLDAYRAQYRIQRADLFPAVSATGSGVQMAIQASGNQGTSLQQVAQGGLLQNTRLLGSANVVNNMTQLNVVLNNNGMSAGALDCNLTQLGALRSIGY